MNDVPCYTTKQTHSVEERKHLPIRPRKYNFIGSSQGAHAVSFVNSENSLSHLYDRNSGSSYMEQCFQIINCIGEGCFGVVFKVSSLDDGKLYAVKKSRERFKSSGDRKRKLKEVERLEKLPKHPNCVQLYRAWEEDGHLFLQIELCEFSLAKYTLTHHFVPEEMVWNVLTDITLALKHLHDRDVMHLDIKLDNILMTKDGTFKLSDFGIALDCSQMLKDALEGDPKYVAPELLSEKFTKSADIFSLGISMLELSFDLNLPQHGVPWQRLREGRIPHFRVRSVSNDLFELMKWMMHPEPERRPTVDAILKHQNVKKILIRRNIKHVIRCLAEPGKLLLSLLSFFGKVGYDVLMAAILRFRRLNQDMPTPIPSINYINVDVPKTEAPEVVTSTPVSEKHYLFSQMTPSSRFNDSWEISSCSDVSMDYEVQSDHDFPSTSQPQGKESAHLHCRCFRRVRSHPYNDKFYQKVCNSCGGKKCTSVRNLIEEFSQIDDKVD